VQCEVLHQRLTRCERDGPGYGFESRLRDRKGIAAGFEVLELVQPAVICVRSERRRASRLSGQLYRDAAHSSGRAVFRGNCAVDRRTSVVALLLRGGRSLRGPSRKQRQDGNRWPEPAVHTEVSWKRSIPPHKPELVRCTFSLIC